MVGNPHHTAWTMRFKGRPEEGRVGLPEFRLLRVGLNAQLSKPGNEIRLRRNTKVQNCAGWGSVGCAVSDFAKSVVASNRPPDDLS